MTAQILPERFTGGDFMAWLRHFDRCSAANGWNDETRLTKLPAFLHGPAAVYFDSLEEEEKNTLPTLLASLQRCFNPAINREKFYQDFEQQALRPSEDPSLYLWRLKDLLRNAEPDLSDEAFSALLRRQFMKGLPLNTRIKLLESDPTPDLATMVSFAQRFRALHELPINPPASCAAVQPNALAPAVPKPDLEHIQQHEYQQQRLDKLESLISNMADQQTNLIAAVASLSSAPAAQSPCDNPTPQGRNRTIRCFYCHEEGHIVRNCHLRRGANRCQTCGGWGHSAQNCANNSQLNTSQTNSRKFLDSLNSQRVPR